MKYLEDVNVHISDSGLGNHSCCLLERTKREQRGIRKYGGRCYERLKTKTGGSKCPSCGNLHWFCIIVSLKTMSASYASLLLDQNVITGKGCKQ